MYQTGIFILKFNAREAARYAMETVRKLVAPFDDWNKRIMVCGSEITVGEDCYLAQADYKGLVLKICRALAEQKRIDYFLCYAEHFSDLGEACDAVSWEAGAFLAYSKEETYDSGRVTEHCYTGNVQNGKLMLEEIDGEFCQREVRCGACGEYYSCSENAPVSRCPYCAEMEAQCVALLEEVQEPEDTDDYAFEIPLGVTFPQTRISQGQEWLEDCEINDTFRLDPACFANKNQYDAALMLCKICAGWFGFESPEERQERADCLRQVVCASPGEPMWYYDVWQRSFDWVAALRECNPRYLGCFPDVDALWELFSRLQQRSFVEKAECFGWFAAFFGENLRYDLRKNLADQYVQGYDNHMETTLYFFPEQIDLLTSGETSVSNLGARYLSGAAAGLIRMGKRAEGIRLYETLFQMVWEGKSTADEKKAVMDAFLERLAAGYENEPYLDPELSAILEKQASKYSDAKWVAKVRMMVNRSMK